MPQNKFNKAGFFTKQIFSHELIGGTVFIFIGSIIGNILAFLLNLFLARSLSYGDYAIFASLLSVITLASIPSNSINTIIVKFSTKYFVEKDKSKIKSLYITFFKFIFGLCVFIIIFFTALSPILSDFLHLENLAYVTVSGIIIVVFYLNILNSGFLQGMMKFKFISIVSIAGGLVKLLMGIFLVLIGYSAFAGLWAIFFMTLTSFLIAYFPLRNFLRVSKSNEKVKIYSKEIRAFAIPAFFSVLFMTSFVSVDVVLVKHFFDSSLAGYYAGLSLLGKVIFYFTAPIPMVMFPLVVKRHTMNVKANNLFYISIILVLIPSILISFLYFMIPELVVKLFLGGREYLYISKYLGWFGIFLTIFSVINVCVNFFLSINKTRIFIVVVGAAVLQIMLIYFFHNSFYQVIGVSIFSSSILLGILIFIFLKNYTSFSLKIPLFK